MQRSVWNTGCDSWYLDANGRNTTVWPGTTAEFRNVTKEVRLEEYEVRRRPPRQQGANGKASTSARASVPGAAGRGTATAAFHAAEEG
jgi:hypothetical protein